MAGDDSYLKALEGGLWAVLWVPFAWRTLRQRGWADQHNHATKQASWKATCAFKACRHWLNKISAFTVTVALCAVLPLLSHLVLLSASFLLLISSLRLFFAFDAGVIKTQRRRIAFHSYASVFVSDWYCIRESDCGINGWAWAFKILRFFFDLLLLWASNFPQVSRLIIFPWKFLMFFFCAVYRRSLYRCSLCMRKWILKLFHDCLKWLSMALRFDFSFGWESAIIKSKGCPVWDYLISDLWFMGD